MGSEAIDKMTSPPAIVAAAAFTVMLKQAMQDPDPAGGFSILLGAGLVLGYLEWRRRQGHPGLTPERPATGKLAVVPALSAIVVGAFCLLHWFFAFVLLCVLHGLTKKHLKALLSDVLATPVPPTPAPAQPVKEAKKPVRAHAPVPAPAPAMADEPAYPPPVATPMADPAPASPLTTTGFSFPTTSTLGTSTAFALESRIPSLLETRLESSIGSFGSGSGTSGFDEALALLQGHPLPDKRAD